MKQLFIIVFILTGLASGACFAQIQGQAGASMDSCQSMHQKAQEACAANSTGSDCEHWNKMEKDCRDFMSPFQDAAEGKGPCGSSGTQIKEACKDASSAGCATAKETFRKCIIALHKPANS